ncbi:MAG: Dam family site-specific DNA-(adenine-N6)-methyltransferase [Labilithrix sp.]|nr:Dam family site-specific DNA-(adenine-N6)-methyltransferase [Labilithrix sp.]
MKPRPFLRWAGGKTAILSVIAPLIPQFSGRYHEPCLGGGALFFDLRSKGVIREAYLTDTNYQLINAYVAVRDHLGGLLGLLAEHAAKHGEAASAGKAKDYYNEVRSQLRNFVGVPAPVQAARFIYINRTCFNGLYRVNKAGFFNVPFGAVKNPVICDAENLRVCSEALQCAAIARKDFAVVETGCANIAQPGDLVYFDPPYVPTSPTSSFTNYTPGGFSQHDHARMAKVASALRQRGVHVVVSNSDVPVVRDLYSSFELVPVRAPRAMAARGSSRGSVQELLIVNG